MTHSQHPPLIIILGPTASGKTKLAIALAELYKGEIISADSRQVYRGMDIGTGKDLIEYGKTPYHLIDIINPDQEYNLYQFSRDFKHCYTGISQRATLPFLVGGTGMYLDAVLSRYNLTIAKTSENARNLYANKPESELISHLYKLKPELHNTTDTNDRSRLIQAISIAEAEKAHAETITWPNFKPFIMGININKKRCQARITQRLKDRIEEGMIEEVVKLKNNDIGWETLENFGLEYRYIAQYLQGSLNYNDMFQKLNSAIHRFAKKQDKWFRKIENKGHDIHWLEADDQLQVNAVKQLDIFMSQYKSISK